MLQLEVLDATGRRTVSVEALPFSIGRSSESHLQLADAQVSRKHAELSGADGSWHIRDCGSRFGTFVNDKKVEECPLKPGDRIRLGQTELRLETAVGPRGTRRLR